VVDNSQLTQDILDLEKVIMMGAVRAELPWLYDTFTSLPLPLAHKVKRMWDDSRKQGYRAVDNARSQNIDRRNIFSTILRERNKEETPLSEQDIATEAQSLLIAGSDTTGITMTYLIWCILQRPELKLELQKECNSLPEEFRDTDLEKLEVLSAVIEEGLRLHAAAPGSLSRAVPRGGAHLSGYYFEEGIKVCTQAYTIHRDPEIFPNPEQ